MNIPAGDTVLGSSRTIQCQSGYQPENSDVSSVVITCLQTGDWSQVPATFNCLIGCYAQFISNISLIFTALSHVA